MTEVLFAGLPEPVDLALDLVHGQMYWTYRGDNTISRATLDLSAVAPDARTDRVIVVRNAGEVIGIALDVAHDAMFFTAVEGQSRGPSSMAAPPPRCCAIRAH